MADNSRIHTIVFGETYAELSQAYYGNTGLWRVIYEANPTIKPLELRPGVKVRIPDPSVVKAKRPVQ